MSEAVDDAYVRHVTSLARGFQTAASCVGAPDVDDESYSHVQFLVEVSARRHANGAV